MHTTPWPTQTPPTPTRPQHLKQLLLWFGCFCCLCLHPLPPLPSLPIKQCSQVFDEISTATTPTKDIILWLFPCMQRNTNTTDTNTHTRIYIHTWIITMKMRCCCCCHFFYFDTFSSFDTLFIMRLLVPPLSENHIPFLLTFSSSWEFFIVSTEVFTFLKGCCMGDEGRGGYI